MSPGTQLSSEMNAKASTIYYSMVGSVTYTARNPKRGYSVGFLIYNITSDGNICVYGEFQRDCLSVIIESRDDPPLNTP